MSLRDAPKSNAYSNIQNSKNDLSYTNMAKTEKNNLSYTNMAKREEKAHLTDPHEGVQTEESSIKWADQHPKGGGNEMTEL